MMYLVRELAGVHLDQAVAMALELEWRANALDGSLREGILVVDRDTEVANPFSPSSVWADGGPIIDREKINIRQDGAGIRAALYTGPGSAVLSSKGPTMLVAAMRAFVAARLGAEVDL